MKFALTEEQLTLGAVVRDFLADRAPLTATLRGLDGGEGDAGRADGDHAWKALAAELDLVGVDVPAGQGGVGLGAVELAVVAERFGAVVYPGPFLSPVGLAVGALLAPAAAGSATAQALLDRALVGEPMTLVRRPRLDPALRRQEGRRARLP